MHSKKMLGKVLYHIIVCGIGLIMIYPLVWMVCSSFKPTSTIFQTAGSLIPEQFTLENYANGWRGIGAFTFGKFFCNSFLW